jgi:hypothetical protein
MAVDAAVEDSASFQRLARRAARPDSDLRQLPRPRASSTSASPVTSIRAVNGLKPLKTSSSRDLIPNGAPGGFHSRGAHR